MRMSVLTSLLLATAGLGHGTGRRTVSSIDYLATYSAGARVSVWRGVTAQIVVYGSLLDLATRAEVRTASGDPTTDVTADIVNRSGGGNTHITLFTQSASTAATGDYRILIHYTVEVSGPDHVDIHLFNRGAANSFSIVESPVPGGKYIAGQAYTLVVSGSKLSGAALDVTSTGVPGMTVLQTLSTSSSEAKFKIRFDHAGPYGFLPRYVYDGAMANPPTVTQQIAGGYTGPTSGFSFSAGAVPVVSGISPASVQFGHQVTVTGTNLTPRGYSAVVRYLRAYSSNTATSEAPASVSGSGLTFSAPSDMRPDSAKILYFLDGSQPVDPVIQVEPPILPALSVKEAPAISQMTAFSATGVPSFKILREGQQPMLGKHLGGALVLASQSLIFAGLTSQKSGPAQSIKPAGTPTVSFGATSLTVNSITYKPPTAISFGVDSLVITGPALSDTATGTLTVTTPDGSATITDVYFVPKPHITEIDLQISGTSSAVANQAQLSGASFKTVTNGVLLRGGDYRLLGTAFELRRGTSLVQRATVRLNGVAMTAPVQAFANVPGLFFRVPATATSGSLAVETTGGVTTFGNVTVTDPPPGFTIAGIVLSPASVAGGQPVTATIAINGTITPGTSAGSLLLSSSTSDTAVIMPSGAISVTSNPMVVTLQTRAVTAVRTTSIVASNVLQATSSSTASAGLQVRPPAPTALTLNPASVTGGHGTTGTVVLNASAAASSHVTVALSSSDPTTATVPATAAMSGTTATFNISTAVVPSSRTVTISTTSDGTTRTATLTVDPPLISSVSLAQSTVVAETPVTATVNLSAAFPSGATATITCSDPALICPASVGISGTSAPFTVSSQAIPSSRTVSVVATVNGVSKTTSLTLVPLAIQSVTLSPASVSGSATSSSLTVQLNSPLASGAPLSVHITSGNTAVVPNPGPVSFGLHDAAKIIALALTSQSRTQSTPVTLTVTFTRQTSFGPATSTATATLTVNP